MRRYLAPAPVGPLERRQPPSFSVVIACYQAAGVVGDAVRSALEQTWPPLEVIVSDDGSTDDLDGALAPFGDRIVRLSGENRGPAAARNAGFRIARGEYVVILDADDVFFPERLQAIADLLIERPDLDIVTTDAVMELNGRPMRNVYNERWTFETADQRRAIIERNFVFGLAAVRREALLASGGMDETSPINPYAEDWELWMRMILSGSAAGLVDDPLARNRLGVGSLSSDRRGRRGGRIAVLEKTLASRGLRPSERDAAESSLARNRAELAALEARFALGEDGSHAREKALAVALAPVHDRRSLLPRTRIRAAAWALAPGRAGRALREEADAVWEGAGTLRHLRGRDQIAVTFYTDASELGGAELSLENLLAALSSRVETSVVGTNRAVVDRLASARPGIEALIVPSIRSLFDVRSIYAHRAAFGHLRPDIVQVNLNHPWACSWAQLAAMTTPGAGVVVVEHLPRPRLDPWDPLIKRVLERGVDAHVTVGKRAADELSRFTGVPTRSLMTIHNGVRDVELPLVSRDEGEFVVGSVGRLHAQKGYDVLVRALASLDDVAAILVGDGDERQALTRLAADLGVQDRVAFRGWADDARRSLAELDVFVLPSRFEAFPLTILEAMLAGLPVVATDVGSVSEAVIEGVTGLLVPPDDVEALAAAIDQLRLDPECRREMGARGRQRVLDLFTSDAMASRYEALYDEVLA